MISPTTFRGDHPPHLTPQRPPPSPTQRRPRRHPTSLPEEFLDDLVQLRRRVSQNFNFTMQQQPQQQQQEQVRTSPKPATTASLPQRSSPSYTEQLRQHERPNSPFHRSPSEQRNPLTTRTTTPRRSPTSFMGVPPTSHRVGQSSSQLSSQHLQLMPSHQVKHIPTFTGQEKTLSIDDWVRDASYLIDTTAIPVHLQFSTIVRYLGGSARKLILNLPLELQTPKDAFAELKAQFSDILSGGDPLAEFYEIT